MTTAKTPPKNKSQTRQVFERLRAGIIAGKLLPDAKLNIAALAEELEVSAGAVREGLAMLESESLVVSEPARGYRVSPVSSLELGELVRARIEIEKLCMAEAIRHGGLEWEGAIVAAFHRLSRLSQRDSDQPSYVNQEWADGHAEFHRALIAGCPNRWLRRMQETLYQQSERYRQLSVPFTTSHTRDVNGEHKAMMEAALNHDVSKAQELMAAHVNATMQLLIESPQLALHSSGSI
ncbi:MAG: FCD domain-containing protein [Pseudomonadota bacterium]